VKISAQEEYGLRCMLQLATKPGASFTVSEIARREGLSVAYVEKLLRILGKAGLAQSQRGIKGGYTLARSSEKITLGDVGRAFGGLQTSRDICGRYTGLQKICVHEGDCTIRPIWQGITDYVMQVMDSIPISEILARRKLIQIAPPSGMGNVAVTMDLRG
jgi:Rrf2 family iron-sulfur cluster assembly transcriptional regulator